MDEVKVTFKPMDGFVHGRYKSQLGLAVSKWSDEYSGKNIFYLYKGGDIDEKLLSESSLVISSKDDSDYLIPFIKISEIKYINEGSVVSVNSNGRLRVVFNPKSSNNALFVTSACNNYCIMCPQPPKKDLDSNSVNRLNEIISLIREEDSPEVLGITGGEPTLIKEGLIEVVGNIYKKFPTTIIQILSNGRIFSYQDFTYEIGQITKNVFVCIPLFGATSDIHDFIVQSKGAFEQTIAGIYECKRNGIDIEVRIVLHKYTIKDLELLAEFICRNIPFVGHVALMGMENMGLAKLNYSDLWVDPYEYKDILGRVVKKLTKFGMSVSVFNLPLCIVDERIHKYCKQSISDFKTKYYEQCHRCSEIKNCAGFFASTNDKFWLTNPANIKPI